MKGGGGVHGLIHHNLHLNFYFDDDEHLQPDEADWFVQGPEPSRHALRESYWSRRVSVKRCSRAVRGKSRTWISTSLNTDAKLNYVRFNKFQV